MRKMFCAHRLAFAGVLAAFTLAAPAAESIDTGAGNLLAVLRESPGANKQGEELRPFGKIAFTAADGRETLFEASWYQYLGDMHLRLVFDGRQQMQSAVPDDLTRLKLSPEQALARAVSNMRQRYGAPVARPYGGGVMQIEAAEADFASSYFLDREFWLAQLREHPEGIVAAVPTRRGLVFAPVADAVALTSLRFSATALYTAQERSRVSSALYLDTDGRWSVFQAPLAAAAGDK
jgi:hypothetical protein